MISPGFSQISFVPAGSSAQPLKTIWSERLSGRLTFNLPSAGSVKIKSLRCNSFNFSGLSNRLAGLSFLYSSLPSKSGLRAFSGNS